MTSALHLRTAAAAAAACLIPLMPAAPAAGHPHRHVDSVKGSAELAIGLRNRATIDASGSPESAKGYIRFASSRYYGTFRVKVDCLWVYTTQAGSTEAWISGKIVKGRDVGSGFDGGPPWTHALFQVYTFQDPQSPGDGKQSGHFRLGSAPIDCTAYEHDLTDAWTNGHFRVRDHDPTN